MNSWRRLTAAAVAVVAMHAGASAQIMRFDTSVGSFDMELNPTNDANLQPLVDNMVAYIGLGRYHYTAINRAPEGFVLQMGSFLGFPPTTNDFLGLLQEIRRFDPVVVDGNNDGQVDFSAQTNTRGTVSLALSSGGPNSGTSSFFINIGDNSFLDSQGFVPFARIVDMANVDKIMDLEKANLSGDPNDLTFNNVPLDEKGRIVILKSVHVLQSAPTFNFTGPIANVLQQEEFQADQAAAASQLAADLSAAAEASSASDASSSSDASPIASAAGGVSGGSGAEGAVPEPSAAVLGAMAALFAVRGRRLR